MKKYGTENRKSSAVSKGKTGVHSYKGKSGSVGRSEEKQQDGRWEKRPGSGKEDGRWEKRPGSGQQDSSQEKRPESRKEDSRWEKRPESRKENRQDSSQGKRQHSKQDSSQGKRQDSKQDSRRVKGQDGKQNNGRDNRPENRRDRNGNKAFQLGKRSDRTVKSKSRCRVFGECGGCQMIDVPYAEQLVQKEKETAKILKPFVKLDGIIGMGQPEYYRNKVNAAFTHERNGKPLSGVYKEGSHYIIPIEKCFLQNEKADAIIGSIRELLPSFKIKTYDEDSGYGLLRHVMVRVGQATGQIMVVLVLSSPILPSKNNFVKALLKQHPDITTIVVNVNDRKTSMVLGDKEQVIYGKGYIEDVLCGITFKLSPKSFYQVNAVQTEKLYGKALEYADLTGKETVLDAYCGIGTIGLIAADKAEQVIGVELNKDAVKDAVTNAKRNNILNVEFYQKDAGEFMIQLEEQGKQIDIVFMDPPRSGSDEVFLKSLVRLGAKKVVYVSCNPETLATDLGYLVKNGYRAVKGVCVDMFPFTRHVECVVLMSRKDK